MIERYTVGTVVRVDASFDVLSIVLGNEVWTPTDPSVLVLKYKDPTGVLTTVTENTPASPTPPLFRDSVGRFYAEIITDEAGWWEYRFSGTGAAEGATEGAFIVTSNLVDVATFVDGRRDYDAIRALLGVTELDLVDDVILLPPFLPAAELLVKSAAPTWATLVATTAGRETLRQATLYGTAARMAQTWAQGGTVGYVMPRQNRDWKATGDTLWEQYNQWLQQAAAAANDTTATKYAVPRFRVSGPTSAATQDLWDGYPPVWTGDE